MNMKSTWMACCLLMLLGIPGMAKDNKTNKSNKYKLVWQEDFKGSSFDAKSWSKIPRDRPDWKRHMSYDDRLYEVKDGKLILYGVNNDGTYQYDLNGDGKLEADTARFVTGGLYTKHRALTLHRNRAKLRTRLNNQHPRHDRCIRKMSCKIWFIHGNTFDSLGIFAVFHL